MADVISNGRARTLVDADGDAVTVTGTALDVNIAGGGSIDLGDIEILGHGTVVHFALNVRNAGNGGPTQLTAQACKHADIMANLSNTGVIYIGASGVGATTGIALNAGDVYSVDVTNTNLLYALSIVDNEDINVVTYG